MNINIVTSLTSRQYGSINNMDSAPEIRKVTTRFKNMIVGGRVVGPSFTAGCCNGGLQWLGNPLLLSSTLCQFCNHISSEIGTPEFVAAISSSRKGSAAAYPSGVPRTKQGNI